MKEKMISELNKKVEPVLITYNRAHRLKETLNAFAQSPFREVRLHVLDNASTDNTELVVQPFRKEMPNLQYHRNAYNISGNGNILRSVEIANTKYHWVIGDDDAWHLDEKKLEALVEILQKADADIIRLGWLVSGASRGKLLSARTLIEQENIFFGSISMISATIIRRSLVTRYLPMAYQNTADHYPHLVPVICGVEGQDLKVYTLSEDLMTHTPSQEPGGLFGDFDWYSGWFRTARYFHEKKLAKKFVNEISFYMCRNNPGFWKQWIWFVKVLLYFKGYGVRQTQYLLSMFGYGAGWKGRIFWLLVVNFLVPMAVAKKMKRFYFFLFKKAKKELRVNRSRL